MQAFLARIIQGLIANGIGKIVGAISRWIGKSWREYKRNKARKKYEKTGDPKDLADFEDELNS